MRAKQKRSGGRKQKEVQTVLESRGKEGVTDHKNGQREKQRGRGRKRERRRGRGRDSSREGATQGSGEMPEGLGAGYTSIEPKFGSPGLLYLFISGSHWRARPGRVMSVPVFGRWRQVTLWSLLASQASSNSERSHLEK